MANQVSNPNEVAHGQIGLSLDGFDKAKAQLLELIDLLGKAGAAAKAAGVGGGAGGGGGSVPSAPGVSAGAGGATATAGGGSPPVPMAPTPIMPTGGGGGGGGGIAALGVRGVLKRIATSPAAIGAGIGLGIDEVLINVEEQRRRVENASIDAQQETIGRGFSQARAIRDTRIAAQVAAGIPEFIARGGVGANEQSVRDHYADERRALGDKMNDVEASTITDARIQQDFVKDVLFAPADLLRFQAPGGRTTANIESLEKSKIARSALNQQSRQLGRSQSEAFAAAQQLDMLIFAQQSMQEASSMRLEMRR